MRHVTSRIPKLNVDQESAEIVDHNAAFNDAGTETHTPAKDSAEQSVLVTLGLPPVDTPTKAAIESVDEARSPAE